MVSDSRFSTHIGGPGSSRSERAALLALVVLMVFAIMLARCGALAVAGLPSGGPAAFSCPAPNGDAYSTAVLADHPLAYYRLDETEGPTMCDSSSSADDGTYNASGITYGVPGALAASSDTALSADGASTTTEVGRSGADPAGLTGNHAFTLEAWFKSATTSPPTDANAWLVGIGGTGDTGEADVLSLNPNHGSQLGWGPSSSFGIDQYGSDFAWDPSAVSVNLWDGNWHYIAVTYTPNSSPSSSAAQYVGYLDGHDLGSPQARPFGNAVTNIAASPIILGDGCLPLSSSCYWAPLDGSLDEVAVYPTALSPERVEAHYAAASQQQLTVSTVGQGTVTSEPSGIDCGVSASSCSEAFSNGSDVTLTATPSPGSTFTGWSGGGCSGTGACTVTMSSNQSVTATFTGDQTLTVADAGTGSGSVSGTGISCPSTCSSSYSQGTQVTLTATPASGSTFTGWSGAGCSGTGTCQVTMSSNQSVTATFTAVPQSPPPPPPDEILAVTIGGTGSGTVVGSGISCGAASLTGQCSTGYTQGVTTTLSENPAFDSTFAGWSGACSGTNPVCQVKMSSLQSVTATFNRAASAQPSSGFQILSQGGGAGVQLPSGNQGLAVNTNGACGLSVQEAYTTGTALEASAARAHRRHKLGLIKPFRIAVLTGGKHYLPLIPTPREIRLWRKHHHLKRARLAAAGGDPIEITCQPLSFSNPTEALTPTPPNNGNSVHVGGLDLDGFCRSIGSSHSQDTGGGWVCVAANGSTSPVNFTAACNWQYPSLSVYPVSGQCYAAGTPTGTSTTRSVTAPPPPPPAPPLCRSFSGSNAAGSLSLSVCNNQVTLIEASGIVGACFTVSAFGPSNGPFTGAARSSKPIALNPSGSFGFNFPGSTVFNGAGQVTASGGSAHVGVGTGPVSAPGGFTQCTSSDTFTLSSSPR